MSISLLTVSILSFVVIILGVALSMKNLEDREKNSPFECGFTPKLSARMPFSMRFFLIAVLFLVFDVEIVILFPFMGSLFWSNMMFSQIYLWLFLLILLIGLYYEINQGSINWTG